MCEERFTRRELGRLGAGALVGGMSGMLGLTDKQTPVAKPQRPKPRMNADEALQSLLDGNARFIAGNLRHPRDKPSDFLPLAAAQRPIVAVVGCADSRVPPEILFDQGVGDMFVVRVAGNVINSAGAVVRGSVEFAVEAGGVPLILVLGHSQCAAVKAGVSYRHDRHSVPGTVSGIARMIAPAVAEVEHNPGDLLANSIESNVRRGVNYLRGLKAIKTETPNYKSVRVVGAVYDLTTGKATLVAP